MKNQEDDTQNCAQDSIEELKQKIECLQMEREDEAIKWKKECRNHYED